MTIENKSWSWARMAITAELATQALGKHVGEAKKQDKKVQYEELKENSATCPAWTQGKKQSNTRRGKKIKTGTQHNSHILSSFSSVTLEAMIRKL